MRGDRRVVEGEGTEQEGLFNEQWRVSNLSIRPLGVHRVVARPEGHRIPGNGPTL
jgi:hypothetical protein